MSETLLRYTGSGEVKDTDVHFVQWIGKTKGGKAVKIVLPKAMCLSNPEWTMAEKDDVVAEIEWSGLYNDEKLAEGDRTEPWYVEYPDSVAAGATEIILGAGKFYIGPSAEEYSSTKTYSVGDLALHEGKIYKCKTAITGQGEQWTPAHWDEEGPTCVGLSRGGGSFVVEREYRNINADGDPGAVEGRIVQEGGQPKLKLSALEWLTKVSDIYAGITAVN